MPLWPCHINVHVSANELRKHGPLLPAFWVPIDAAESVNIPQGSVLLDTGASGTMIDEATATLLRYPIQGKEEIHGAHGYGTLNKYLGKLALPVVGQSGESLAIGIPTECTGMPQLKERYAGFGVVVVGVLGRNFLQCCHLEIDGLSGRTLLRIDESILLPRD